MKRREIEHIKTGNSESKHGKGEREHDNTQESEAMAKRKRRNKKQKENMAGEGRIIHIKKKKGGERTTETEERTNKETQSWMGRRAQ